MGVFQSLLLGSPAASNISVHSIFQKPPPSLASLKPLCPADARASISKCGFGGGRWLDPACLICGTLFLPPLDANSKVLGCLSLGWDLSAPYRTRPDSSGFPFIADLSQVQRGLCQVLTVSVPGGGKSRGERVRYRCQT